jgi:hypothetical protein
MGRNSKKRPEDRAPKKSRQDLLVLLDECRDFLRSSAASFDGGLDHEAKRLAVTLRVLLHDTAQSHALLTQLGVRDRLRWLNSADPIRPGNLLQTPGLVIMRVQAGSGGTYIAPLDQRPFEPVTCDFAAWWHEPVSRLADGTWCRKDYVLTLANKEGGAHVDPDLTPRYDRLVREKLGWMYFESGVERPFDGNVATASVRQIAYEVTRTLDQQLPDLL